MEKFGIWWIGRALCLLVIVAWGLSVTFGVVFGGRGSFAGALVLFSYSAVFTFKEFLRDKL
jgi:hypothetical protein